MSHIFIPSSSGLTVGTTAITGGTNTYVLYDNNGVVGEYTITGTGTVVAMQTSPSFVTPVLGVATGTSLALGGTLGSGHTITIPQGGIIGNAGGANSKISLSDAAGTLVNYGGNQITLGSTAITIAATGGHGSIGSDATSTYMAVPDGVLVRFQNNAATTGARISTSTSAPLEFGTNGTPYWTLGASGGMVGDTLALGGTLTAGSLLDVSNGATASSNTVYIRGTNTPYASILSLYRENGIVELDVLAFGTTNGGTTAGISNGGLAKIDIYGTSVTGLAIGSTTSDPLYFYTNNTLRATFGATGIATFATALDLPAGTVSNPSVTFGDADTGIYAPAGGQLAVAINGVQILKFTNGVNETDLLSILYNQFTDTGTNTVVDVDHIVHNSSGSIAAGFGTGIAFDAQSTTTASRNMGELAFAWTTATDASRTSKFVLKTVTGAAAAASVMEWGATGVTSYANVATTGWGVPAIYSSGRATAQTAANASVATYTCGAADGSFLVSANVLVTTSSAENFTATVSYTDEGNTARTLTLNFQTIAGVIGTAINFANGAVPYEGVAVHLRVKASTAITIKTAGGGTYTGCTYNVEGFISQIA